MRWSYVRRSALATTLAELRERAIDVTEDGLIVGSLGRLPGQLRADIVPLSIGGLRVVVDELAALAEHPVLGGDARAVLGELRAWVRHASARIAWVRRRKKKATS